MLSTTEAFLEQLIILAKRQEQQNADIRNLAALAARAACQETLGDKWAAEFGEAVTQAKAAKILCCAEQTVMHILAADGGKTIKKTPAPHSKIVTRTLATWALSPSAPPRIKKTADNAIGNAASAADAI